MDWEDSEKKRKALWLTMESKPAKTMLMFWRRLAGRDPFYGDNRAYDFAHGRHRASRIQIVNHLIATNGYKSYLEIGVRRTGAMFENINVEARTGVDPDPNAKADHCMTSDAFFAQNARTFDIVFIDGNHTGEQVRKDIENSLAALSPNGVIVLHDMNPPSMFHAREVYEVDGRYPAWNGSSWKGFAWARAHRADVAMCVVDTDWGVGIIHRGAQQTIDLENPTYDDLAADRDRILNLISVGTFLDRYSAPISDPVDARAV
ncbi:class I SAM-dependent methyltransferase [Jannaschia aquimarina]|uniref:Class I SAM-dependent methyltransferase n=1 Tax=Jannaschia aquimarina TaxID=935700 RepID=A0A0D1EQM9_9RHOB|nr:class I SAM-dependent methyltransferase [Jannaschia aquimarina]KIT17940.1 hypothetical protein jaqu_02970 [Jannaschia aquimarina]SNT08487.1 Methyltransferase domain-containing protein [Jannaschia aquimarina]